jgi:hypothetical protein
MMQFLEFTFQSFWHFLGVWALLLVVGNMVARIRLFSYDSSIRVKQTEKKDK